MSPYKFGVEKHKGYFYPDAINDCWTTSGAPIYVLLEATHTSSDMDFKKETESSSDFTTWPTVKISKTGAKL
jgi:hypothetical protein